MTALTIDFLFYVKLFTKRVAGPDRPAWMLSVAAQRRAAGAFGLDANIGQAQFHRAISRHREYAGNPGQVRAGRLETLQGHMDALPFPRRQGSQIVAQQDASGAGFSALDGEADRMGRLGLESNIDRDCRTTVA